MKLHRLLTLPLMGFRWVMLSVWVALGVVHLFEANYVGAGVAIFTGAMLYAVGGINAQMTKLTARAAGDAMLFLRQLQQVSKMAADWHAEGTCASCGKSVDGWDIGVDCVREHRCHIDCLTLEDEGGRVRPRCPVCLSLRSDHATDQRPQDA